MDLGGCSEPRTAVRYRKIAPDDLADRLFAHGWDFTETGTFQSQDKTARTVGTVVQLEPVRGKS